MEQYLHMHLVNVLHSPLYENTFVVLMGDHGLSGIRCDYTTPFLGIFAPSLWSQTSPGRIALDALERNTKALGPNGIHRDIVVSTWDMYATLRHLISWVNDGSSGDHFGLRELSTMTELQSRVTMRFDTPSHPRAFRTNQFGWATRVNVSQGPFAPRSLLSELHVGRGCLEAGVARHHCNHQSGKGSKIYDCTGVASPFGAVRLQMVDAKNLSRGLASHYPELVGTKGLRIAKSFLDTIAVMDDVVDDLQGHWCGSALNIVLQTLRETNANVVAPSSRPLRSTFASSSAHRCGVLRPAASSRKAPIWPRPLPTVLFTLLGAC